MEPPLLLSTFLHVASTLLSFIRAGGAQGAPLTKEQEVVFCFENQIFPCKITVAELLFVIQPLSVSVCDTALVHFQKLHMSSNVAVLPYFSGNVILSDQHTVKYSIATRILLVVIRAAVSFQTGSPWSLTASLSNADKVCKF